MRICTLCRAKSCLASLLSKGVSNIQGVGVYINILLDILSRVLYDYSWGWGVGDSQEMGSGDSQEGCIIGPSGGV